MPQRGGGVLKYPAGQSNVFKRKPFQSSVLDFVNNQIKNEFRNRMKPENLENLLFLALYQKFKLNYNELARKLIHKHLLFLLKTINLKTKT
jgi:hypothetical protein